MVSHAGQHHNRQRTRPGLPQASRSTMKPLVPYGKGCHVDEIIFVVEEAPEGGYSARALGVSIFSEADDLETLQKELRDAVMCHFENESERPRIIRLHFVRDRLLAV
jgi:hypothetical protein